MGAFGIFLLIGNQTSDDRLEELNPPRFASDREEQPALCPSDSDRAAETDRALQLPRSLTQHVSLYPEGRGRI